MPTLIAGGTDDRLDPVANDHTLARLIPGPRLVLSRNHKSDRQQARHWSLRVVGRPGQR